MAFHWEPSQKSLLVPESGSSVKSRSRTERRASSPSWAYWTAKDRFRESVADRTAPTARTTNPVITIRAIPIATTASTRDWPLRARVEGGAFKDVPFIHLKITFIRCSLQIDFHRQTTGWGSGARRVCRTSQTGSIVGGKNCRAGQNRKDDIDHVHRRERQIGNHNPGFKTAVENFGSIVEAGSGRK